MTKISEITKYIEQQFPTTFQESWDNNGILVGESNIAVKAVLVTLDVTEAVVDEAIQKGANLIVAHHPVIFSGLKSITGKNYTERIILKAIRNRITIFAAHTNADSLAGGVNTKICEKIGIENPRSLSPVSGKLCKLVVFVPLKQAEQVRQAIFNSGAGFIGKYDNCSFNAEGKGSFRASEDANPFVGEKGRIHFENEVKIETILPRYLLAKVVREMIKAHPYEEPAYDVYPLENVYEKAGLGMIGQLRNEMNEKDFLAHLKKVFHVDVIRHTALLQREVKTVAVCGGSGSFLLNKAIASGADVFVSGDFKYHQFFDADNRILIADVGHFETEQFVKEVFYALISKKFSTFAVYSSEINTNPINFSK